MYSHIPTRTETHNIILLNNIFTMSPCDFPVSSRPPQYKTHNLYEIKRVFAFMFGINLLPEERGGERERDRKREGGKGRSCSTCCFNTSDGKGLSSTFHYMSHDATSINAHLSYCPALVQSPFSCSGLTCIKRVVIGFYAVSRKGTPEF